MINKLKQQFRNLKFQKKIIGISVVISLIPIILLGLFSYTRMRSLLIEREETAIEESLHQEVLQLDHKLDSYLSSMNLIIWNENIRLALSQKYDSNFEMYLTYRDTIDPLFLTIRSLNTDITAITIYTDTNIYPHGNTLLPLADAQDKIWYEQALNTSAPFFSLSEDGQTLYLICQMQYSYVSYTSIICMTIDLPSAMLTANSLFNNNYGFLLADPTGETMYQYTNLVSVASAPNTSSDVLIHDELPGYITKAETLPDSGWVACLYRPARSVSAAAINITYIVLAMILLCIVLIFLVSALLSKIIVAPIKTLSLSMEQVEQGNYQVEIYSDNTDEVGQLICSFQKMVHTLNNLVNEVLLAQIRQQRYEIEILQSQINPHFLYNSLSLINSKAIISGQRDISQMARLLSTFYRTMLNKGKQITTIASELENTKSYVSIQQMMHSQSFDAIYDIDENLLEYPIPNLLLQPLAENAIIHGLDHRELSGRAILSISCYQENQDIIFKVMDNGCGMSDEECEQILTKDSKGYGVKNVHQRMQLYYGPEYGLAFHSTKGMGTYVLLKVRKDINQL
ncbi:MAG: sensor histidine kinase [Lachnospiraceae bacterium]|nr:sensor histidine kinase [Lachnospiraceae bacterium]